MKKIYWLTVILFIASIKIYGQEFKVYNSFIIILNDKVITTVSGLQLSFSDATGKKDSIDGGYFPGALYVDNLEEKNLLQAYSLKNLTLTFDTYDHLGNKRLTHNYKIEIDRSWFNESYIILRIFDVNKKKGSYKYSFEVPGVYFSTTRPYRYSK